MKEQQQQQQQQQQQRQQQQRQQQQACARRRHARCTASHGRSADTQLCWFVTVCFRYDAHHAVTRDSFFALVRGPRCDHVREAADALLLELAASEALIEKIASLSPPLPQQQIHADLHFANVLIHDGRVQGVLDFEFSAPDWRCMELAVGLSKYIATPDAEPAFVAWVDGYKQGGGSLTKDEAELAPELIILRVLNNVREKQTTTCERIRMQV